MKTKEEIIKYHPRIKEIYESYDGDSNTKEQLRLDYELSKKNLEVWGIKT